MRPLLSLLACLALVPSALASHIVGGFISAKPVAGQAYNYQITVTMYYDVVNGSPAAQAANAALLCFGDGSTVQQLTRVSSMTTAGNPGTMTVNTYQTTHTYAGPGTYTLQAAFNTRSDGIQNLGNGTSTQAFVLKTTLLTSATLVNSTPMLAIPLTVMQLALNQPVSLPLAAADAEGDSLSYALASPLTNRSIQNSEASLCTTTSEPAQGYVAPNDVKRVGTYRLNPRTGLLNWDVPTEQGRYAVAITVTEWRQGIRISESQLELTLWIVDRGGTPVVPPAYQPASLANITAASSLDLETIRLSVAPNPILNDLLQLELQTTHSQPVTLQILDGQGRTWQRLELNGNTATHRQTFDLSGQPAGLYFIRAESEGKQVVRKVLKE